MRIPIERKAVKVMPDTKRVIARFFYNGPERAQEILDKVEQLSEDEVFSIISPLLQEFSKRHRNITRIFNKHTERLYKKLQKNEREFEGMSDFRKLLIGSYFTHEYSIESAAFFNPSMIEDVDQSNLEDGQKRVIISFRAVGEGHISSIVFRKALIDKNNNIDVLPAGIYVDEAEIIKNNVYTKSLFFEKAEDSLLSTEILKKMNEALDDNRNDTVSATSSAWPNRREGILVRYCSFRVAGRAWVILVFIKPGEILRIRIS